MIVIIERYIVVIIRDMYCSYYTDIAVSIHGYDRYHAGILLVIIEGYMVKNIQIKQ